MRLFFLLLTGFITCTSLVLLNACNKKHKQALVDVENNKKLSNTLPKIDFYDYDHIAVGNFGGFTGGKKMFLLDHKGKIQMIKQMKAGVPSDTSKFYTLSKADNEKLHKAIKDSQIAETQLDEPGNMTYFITLYKQEAEHTVKWGKSKDLLPSNIKDLYNVLMGYCIKE